MNTWQMLLTWLFLGKILLIYVLTRGNHKIISNNQSLLWI